jgi:transposase-like protein
MGTVFSKEFKEQIVELHRKGGRPRGGESDKQKVRRLERELARKEEELQILGKALAFFARRADQ